MKTSITKKELADILSISASTLQRLLNQTLYYELNAVGYRKNTKILTPRMLKIINDYWGFENVPE